MVQLTLNSLYHNSHDEAATLYYQLTREDTKAPVYFKWGPIAYCFCGYSVKLRALAALTYQIFVASKREILVFCDWLVTQWNVEIFVIQSGVRNIPTNAQISLSVGGCICRLGWMKDNVLIMEQTYDQVLQDLAVAKTIPVIAGQADS
ncbi:MAG: hypothetical protein Q9179_003261 [Wetmoreana sp. 5 TL-2023]